MLWELGRVGCLQVSNAARTPSHASPDTAASNASLTLNSESKMTKQTYTLVEFRHFPRVIFDQHRRHFPSAQCVQGLGFILFSQAPVTQARRHCIRLFSASLGLLGPLPLLFFFFFCFLFFFFSFFLFLFLSFSLCLSLSLFLSFSPPPPPTTPPLLSFFLLFFFCLSGAQNLIFWASISLRFLNISDEKKKHVLGPVSGGTPLGPLFLFFPLFSSCLFSFSLAFHFLIFLHFSSLFFIFVFFSFFFFSFSFFFYAFFCSGDSRTIAPLPC